MSRTGGGFPGWLRATRAGQFLSVRLGAFYIRLCLRTIRWTIEGKDHLDRVVAGGGPLIAAIWHGRLFFSPTWAPPGRRTVAMISNNRDGELIAGIVSRFNVATVRGSTYDREKRRDKGGAAALHQAERELGRGSVVAITPDGPRGPRMRAQNGAAQLSAACRCPVVPVAFSVTWGRILPSWDRFLVPYPFCRGAVVYGAPIGPPPDSSPETVEALRQEIEEATTRVTNRADDLCGRPHVVPMEPLDTERRSEAEEQRPRSADAKARPAE